MAEAPKLTTVRTVFHAYCGDEDFTGWDGERIYDDLDSAQRETERHFLDGYEPPAPGSLSWKQFEVKDGEEPYWELQVGDGQRWFVAIAQRPVLRRTIDDD